MVGIPDGLGAFDNGDGTFTVLMNHELGQTAGVVRAHGAIGAFVSQLVIDSTTFEVKEAKDAITQVQLWNDLTDSFVASTYAIGRLCSADLADVSASSFVDTLGTVDTSDDVTYGTTDRLFLSGEEIGPEGKNFAVVITGAEAGQAYELAYQGLFSWENSVASPFAQRKTITISAIGYTAGKAYLIDVQSHNALADPELVQGGQLLTMFVDTPVLLGGVGNDTLFGSFADESFRGFGGNDDIRAGSGVDTI